MAKRSPNITLAYQLTESVLIAAVEHGEIDPDGKTTEQLNEAFAKYIASFRASSDPIYMVVDHKEDLIKRARQEYRKANYHFAALFYATWVEHWVNWYVRCLAVRTERMSAVEIKEMVREVNLRGKLGWLNRALGGKSFSDKHRNAITRLADFRNAFVHFKHPPIDVDAEDPESTEAKRLLDSIEKTIKYLHTHDRVVIERNLRKKIRAYVRRNEN